MPPIDNLLLLSASASEAGGGSVIDDDEEELDDKALAKLKISGVGGKGDSYKCEKCGKTYRHPACLTKHRWQHTEYWKEASKLMLSKHQSVQMLEAAAILMAPTGLPEEKSFWPAAVSPPASGLLGHEYHNSVRLLQSRSLGGHSPLAASPIPLAALDHRDTNHDDDDDTSSNSSMMDLDSRADEGELFEFEMDGEGGSAQTSGPEDGGFTGVRHHPPPTMGNAGDAGLLHPRAAQYAARAAHAPAVAYGVSAPPIGFFTVRPGPHPSSSTRADDIMSR